MTDGSFMDKFNAPKGWSVFDKLNDAFDEIKATRLIERLAPVLDAYYDVTRPYHFRERVGGKRSERFVDTFVFSTGLRPRGSMGHRVVRVQPGQQLSILDLDRIMDDSEIFKPGALHTHRARLLKLTRNYQGRLDLTLKQKLPTVKEKLGNSARWVDDINFLHRRDPYAFCDLAGARPAIIDAMMQAVEDILPEQNRKMHDYVRGLLTECLEAFDRERQAEAKTMLRQASEALNADALEALSRNPSSLTGPHYKWLNESVRAEVKAFRMNLARNCPVALLVDKFVDKFAPFEKDGDVDAALQHVFHAEPQRLYFYKTLSEDRVGTDMARRLDMAAFFIERGEATDLPLRTPQDWKNLSLLIEASWRLGKILDRPHPVVFKSCVEEILSANMRLEELASQDFLSDVAMLRNRIATHALAPKIIAEGARNGLRIPVPHALYIASFEDCLRDAASTVPSRLRTEIQDLTERVRLVNLILRGKSVKELLESARFYSTYYDAEDERWRNAVITNRMDEQAASYVWAGLPELEIDGYTVKSMTSQADLLKNTRETGDDLWLRSVEGITGGSHFVKLVRNAATQASAVLIEPAGEAGQWSVDTVVPARAGMRSNNAEDLFQDYINMPEFLDGVNLQQIQTVRRALYQKLMAKAQDSERLGMFDLNDPAERTAKLRVLHAHWPGRDKFEIEDGYISDLTINARVKALVGRLAPLYRHKGRHAAPKGPGPA